MNHYEWYTHTEALEMGFDGKDPDSLVVVIFDTETEEYTQVSTVPLNHDRGPVWTVVDSAESLHREDKAKFAVWDREGHMWTYAEWTRDGWYYSY